MAVKDVVYQTDDDLGVSFEDYLISQYTECSMDRRVPCIICRKQCSVCFKYKGNIVDCHKECIAFLLFYQFIHQYDVVSLVGNGKQTERPNLMRLYEMPYEVPKSTHHKYRCMFCGAKSAYFKCTSENCTNYYHVHCNTNNMVIAYHNAADGRRPSYRFLLCQTHMNVYEIDLVKCRFHSKISLLAEYDFFNQGRANMRPLSSQGGTGTSYSSNTSATKANHKKQPNVKQVKNERKLASSRPGTTKKKVEDGSIIQPAELKIEKVHNLTSSQASDKSSHMKDYITCLMNEYGAQRRQLYQKNTKKFEWWPYDILFSKIGPDLFGSAIPESSILIDLYSDLRDLLCSDCPITCISDINKVVREAEPSIVGISNSIAAQLHRKMLSSQPPVQNGNFAYYSNESRDISTSSSTEEYYHSQYNENAVHMDTQVGQKSLAVDTFQLSNAPNSRPIFAVAKIGSTFMWFSYVYMRSKKQKQERVMILDFVPINEIEFEYLRRVLKSVYYLGSCDRVVPIISKEPCNRSDVDREEGEEEMAVVHEKLKQERTSINIGGFSWELNPSPLSYLKRKLPSLANSTSADAFKIESFNESQDEDQIDDNMGVNADVERRTFVVKQSKCFISALNVVNSAIGMHTQRLKSSLDHEFLYSTRVHDNKELVDQYGRVAMRMNRWSHFRHSLQQSIDLFNYLLTFEASGGEDSTKADSIRETMDKEFCSVCLLSEQAFKQLLHQCARCFVRVHYKCYVSYRPTSKDPSGGITREEDKSTPWYCEPCEYDMMMTKGDIADQTCNSAVCCVCCSSGGALKLIMESGNRKGHSSSPPKWIHLLCAAFLMPTAICQEWIDLSKWELRGIKLNSSGLCCLCQESGGHLIKCALDECSNKFHITCGWVSGAYVEESYFHNTGELLMQSKSIYGHLFPSLSYKLWCVHHTNEKFSEEAVKVLMRRRCHAYTHYLYSPASSVKASKDQRIANLPLKLCPSPVAITKEGPIKTYMTREQSPAPMPKAYSMPIQQSCDASQMPRAKSIVRHPPSTPQTVPQQILVHQTPQNMVMVNTPPVMMHNGAQMIIAGGQPMIVNSAPALVANRMPTMVLNGGHQVVMNSVQPSYIVASHQPRMMMMNSPRGLVPKDTYPGMMGQVSYSGGRTYVNGTQRYGVSAIVSNMPNSGYVQVAQPPVTPVEIPMHHVVTAYEQPPMMAAPVSRGMVQHPQFQTNGYVQPVQLVSKYWDPRMNQVQYNETQLPRDSQYYGVGGGGMG